MVDRDPHRKTEPLRSPPGARTVCIDCAQFVPDGPVCPRCRGPRLVCHAELGRLSIAHVDCDAFYAAVEKRDRPELRNRPLIVAGISHRSVVTTACYLARMHGVRSAMPLYKAQKLCPDAIVLPPDFPRYRNVSREIHALMEDAADIVQSASIDEAWLDLSSAVENTGSAVPVLADFALRAEHEVGISVSIGLSYCKSLAKMASDLDKPRGFSVVGRGDALSFLAPLPVERLHGVGPSLKQRLADHGMTQIGQLQSLGPEWLMRRFGRTGKTLYEHSLGIDEHPVRPPARAKSVSAETTFSADISSKGDILAKVKALSNDLGTRLRHSGLRGRTVILKLKTSNFRVLTRQTTLAQPTEDAGTIGNTAARLAEPLANGTSYRLVGVGISSMSKEGEEYGERNLELEISNPAEEPLARTRVRLRS